MERLTFEGNFCDIAKCEVTPGGSFCEYGYCDQRRVWERLKAYEDTGKTPEEVAALVQAEREGLPIIQETEDDMEFMHYRCPKCKVVLHQHYKKSREKMRYNQKYCHECGQKLNWGAAREAAEAALAAKEEK